MIVISPQDSPEDPGLGHNATSVVNVEDDGMTVYKNGYYKCIFTLLQMDTKTGDLYHRAQVNRVM